MNERQIIQALAFSEADFLWQIPSYVHVLTACVIRSKSSDSGFAGPCVSEKAVRQWAAANFESRCPQGEGRYTGPLDLDYSIQVAGSRIVIAGRLVNEPEEPASGNGGHGFSQPDTEWETAYREASSEIHSFLADATRELADCAPPGLMLSVVIDKLLDIPQIQECLGSLELAP